MKGADFGCAGARESLFLQVVKKRRKNTIKTRSKQDLKSLNFGMDRIVSVLRTTRLRCTMSGLPRFGQNTVPRCRKRKRITLLPRSNGKQVRALRRKACAAPATVSE